MVVTLAVLINYRNKVNKNGLYPIHIRVTIDGKPNYYSVPLPAKVPLHCWEGKDAYWVNNSHPYGFEINNAINKTRNDIINLHKSLHNQGRKFTFYHIDKLFNFRGNRMLFNDYFKTICETHLPPLPLPM